MLDTGFAVRDAAMVLTVGYVAWGGWLVTVAGLVASARLLRGPGSRRRGAELLAASLAPIANIAAWALVALVFDGRGDLGAAGFVALAGLHILLVLAGPMAALREAATLRRRVGGRGRITVRAAGMAAPRAPGRRASLA